MAKQEQYDGVACTPEKAFTAWGGIFGNNEQITPDDPPTTESIEALRELLPYAALGWAPEFISGEGEYCGPRALARSLVNMLRHHEPGYKIPEACSFPRLLETLLSEEFKTWRVEQQRKTQSEAVWGEQAQESWSQTGCNFADQDLNYLLAYINHKKLLPMKFRLGVIRQMGVFYTQKGGGRRRQITKPDLMALPEAGNSPYPVLWIHYIAGALRDGEEPTGHWQSIGPEPSSEGLELFRSWGLAKEAKQVVINGLFYVSKNGFEKIGLQEHPEDVKMLNLQKYTFLYKHPANSAGIFPRDWRAKGGESYIWAVLPRSDFHVGKKSDDRKNRLQTKSLEREGHVYIGTAVERPDKPADGKRYDSQGDLLAVQQLEQYPEISGGPRKERRMCARKEVHGNIFKGTPYTPSLMPPKFGNINLPYSPPQDPSSSPRPGSSSTPGKHSTPVTPPDSAPVPEEKTPCTPWPGGKSPKKRGPPQDSGTTGGSPPKKAKRDDDARSPVDPPTHGVGIKQSIYRPYSARHIRMFRAKEDSNVKSCGEFYDNLEYRTNDILVAIEPIPDKPFCPFWARTQDLREGMASPGQLEEFTEELYGPRYLPYGLQDADVLTPVPMTFSTYLMMGENRCNSLRNELGVAYDAQWPNDVIKQILEHRLRQGVPIAFWKGLDAVMFEHAPPPIVERYVRMKYSNSNTFRTDNEQGQAYVWMEHPSVTHHYLPRSNQVMYAHDMNWGLRLRKRKHRDDLTSEDTRLVKEVDKIMPPSYYAKPVVHRPLTLVQKGVQKGRQFLFGEPTSGKKTKFDFQTTTELDFWNYKKMNGFDNSDQTPREVVAIENQHPRFVVGHGQCLQFIKGDLVFMDVPLGARPYQGWKARLSQDGRPKPGSGSGFVYPSKVRDLNAEEKRLRDLAIRGWGACESNGNFDDEIWMKKMQADADAKDARKKAIAYGGASSTMMPPTRPAAAEEMTTEPPPNTKTAPIQPGEWFGGAPLYIRGPDEATWMARGKKKKRPNSIACLNAFMQLKEASVWALTGEAQKKAISELNPFREWDKDFEAYLKTDKGWADSLTQNNFYEVARDWGTPTNVLTEVWGWQRSPAATKIPFHLPDDSDNNDSPSRWRTLPTTNYVKPLIGRSPIAGRTTRPVNDRNKLKHLITVYHKRRPAPKMGPLIEEKKEEKKSTRTKRRREAPAREETQTEQQREGGSSPKAQEVRRS